MAVHEAALLLLAGAAHLQRRGLHLRGARPALLQDRQLREPLLQRAPAPGAADDEPRRAQVRRALHRDARARRARQDHPSREFILLCFFPESIQRELVRHVLGSEPPAFASPVSLLTEKLLLKLVQAEEEAKRT